MAGESEEHWFARHLMGANQHHGRVILQDWAERHQAGEFEASAGEGGAG